MKFLEAVANVFRVPDLRKRLLFTLALLAVYRLGGHIPTPGIDANQSGRISSARTRARCLASSIVFSGGTFRRLTIFALGIMPYITSSIILQLLTVVVPDARKAAERRRTRAAQDHAVDPLSDGHPGADSVLWHRDGAAGRAAGLRHQSRTRLHPDDHAELDHRHGVHHVAGRTDYRARHRQRHVADHLYRHRGRPAERHSSKWSPRFKPATGTCSRSSSFWS